MSATWCETSLTCSDTVSRSCAPRLSAVRGMAACCSGAAAAACGEAAAIARSVSIIWALLVVRKRIERPPRLIGRQRIGVVRGWWGCRRHRAGLRESREGKRRAGEQAGEQDRPEQIVRHEGPFEYVHDASRNVSSAFAHASCRIASFRRDRVSKVCYRGGVLLAFAASQKCLLNGPPITSPDQLLQILNTTMGVNLVRLPRTR